MRRLGLTGTAMVALAAIAAGQSTTPPRWHLVADLPLPGSATRFDYQSLDTISGRLWIAHMGASEVIAVDVSTRRVITRITDLSSPTGILAAPTLDRVFVSLSGAHAIALVEGSGRVVARVTGGRFPDGLDYDPGSGRLFVSDEHGNQELVISPAAAAPLAPIPLGGEAGNTRYDPRSGRVWVAVQTRNELVAIDPRRMVITAHLRVPGLERPHGLVLDPRRERAYVAGEGNDRLAVVDLANGSVLQSAAVGHEPDVLALDPDRGRIFVGSEGGTISTFDISGDSLRPLAAYEAAHAHSVAVDPRSHLVYVPLESVAGRPVLRVLSLE